MLDEGATYLVVPSGSAIAFVVDGGADRSVQGKITIVAGIDQAGIPVVNQYYPPIEQIEAMLSNGAHLVGDADITVAADGSIKVVYHVGGNTEAAGDYTYDMNWVEGFGWVWTDSDGSVLKVQEGILGYAALAADPGIAPQELYGFINRFRALLSPDGNGATETSGMQQDGATGAGSTQREGTTAGDNSHGGITTEGSGVQADGIGHTAEGTASILEDIYSPTSTVPFAWKISRYRDANGSEQLVLIGYRVENVNGVWRATDEAIHGIVLQGNMFVKDLGRMYYREDLGIWLENSSRPGEDFEIPGYGYMRGFNITGDGRMIIDVEWIRDVWLDYFGITGVAPRSDAQQIAYDMIQQALDKKGGSVTVQIDAGDYRGTTATIDSPGDIVVVLTNDAGNIPTDSWHSIGDGTYKWATTLDANGKVVYFLRYTGRSTADPDVLFAGHSQEEIDAYEEREINEGPTNIITFFFQFFNAWQIDGQNREDLVKSFKGSRLFDWQLRP